MTEKELEAEADRLLDHLLTQFGLLMRQFLADVKSFGKTMEESSASDLVKKAIAKKLFDGLDQLDAVADKAVLESQQP